MSRPRSPAAVGLLPLSSALALALALPLLFTFGPEEGGDGVTGAVRSALPLPDPLEADPAWGVAWRTDREAPVVAQRRALDDLVRGLGWMALAGIAVTALAAAAVLGADRDARGSERAVRSALGASPADLRRAAGRRTASVGARALLLGAAFAALAAGVVSATWPGGAPEPRLLLLPWPALAVAAAVLVPGWLRAARVDHDLLRAGAWVTEPRHLGLRRRIRVAVQVAVGVGVTAFGFGLWSSPDPAADASGAASAGDAAARLVLVEAALAEGGTWTPSRHGRTLAAESIASAGAWRGVGVEAFVVADCGACTRGGMYVPLLGGTVDHHSVTGAFFDHAGFPVVGGRTLTVDDDAQAPRVVVVNETFARSHFEEGGPVGRGLRIGTSPQATAWYTVVGVVADPPPEALGARRTPPEAAVYLSALQHPPERAVLAWREAASPAAAPPVAERVAALGGVATGPPIALGAARARWSAPVRWAGSAAAVTGLLVLALALVGVHQASRVDVRRLERELAVRRALGAPPRALAAWLVRRRLTDAGWGGLLGAWLATALAALAGESAEAAATGPLALAVIALALTLLAALTALGQAAAAARVPAARALAGGG